MRGLLALFVAMALVLTTQRSLPMARAATFVVNSTLDEADLAPGDGSCVSITSAVCTLRAAIDESNALAGADVIQVPAGTYVLSPAAAVGVQGQLNITTDISIEPAPLTAAVTISGAGLPDASIFGLTDAASILRLTGLTIANQAAGHPAIEVLTGTVTISSSTLSGNAGGAIRLNGAATSAQISTSTISGNSSVTGTAGLLLAVSGATATLNHVTLANNTATGGSGIGGVHAVAGTTVTVTDSILAGNTGTDGNDCYGAITTANANIIVNAVAACVITGPAPITTAPALAALGAGGGPTATQVPGPASPAVNAAGACNTASDQRGVSRPRGGACDLGAVELPVVSFTPTSYGVSDSTTTLTITGGLDAALPFDLTVAYTLANGTALNGTDYSGAGGSFTFLASATSATSGVSILRNTAITGNRNFTATLAPTAATAGTGPATITITDVDAPVANWSAANYTVGEAAGTVTVQATLSAADAQDVTITFSTVEASARAGVEFVAVTGGTIFIAQGNTSGTATVTINNNGWDANPSKTLTVRITGVSHGTIGTADATVTITDDEDTPAARLSASSYSVTEPAGSTNAVVSITVPYTSEVPIDVTYGTSNGTALAGADFTATSGTTTIVSGTTSTNVNVPILNNAYYSGPTAQTFTFALSTQTPGGPVGSPASATISITDNETPPIVTLGSPGSVSEAAGSVAIAASVPYTSEVPITVNYATVDGSAEAGADYTAAATFVTIPVSTTSASISINLTNNTYYSGNQSFTVQLSSQSPGGVNTNSATVTLTDTEVPPATAFSAASYTGSEAGGSIPFAIVVPYTSEVAITVPYTIVDGTAIAGRDHGAVNDVATISAGTSSTALAVPVLNNGYYSGTRGLSVQLGVQSIGSTGSPSTAAFSITEDDPVPAARIETPSGGGYTVSELSGNAVVTVTLPYTSTSIISVDYATANDTATAGVDYLATSGSLNIPAGQLAGTVSIPILNNNVFTLDRFFVFRLNSQVPGTLGGPTSAQVTIVDAQQPPTVQFAVPSFNVARNIGTAPITVTLSAPTGITVTVPYTMGNGTALAGVDYTPSNGTLTFAPGITTTILSIPILNSGVYVGDRAFNMGLGTPVQASLGDNRLASVLIRETNAFRVYLTQIRKLYDSHKEYEPNASLTSAGGPMASGEIYRGGYDLDQADQYGLDRDTWWFRAAGPGQVIISVTSNDPGRQVKLMGASGADIPGGYTGDPSPTVTFTVNVTSAGTYYVRVYSSARLGSGQYELRVTHP